MMKHLVLVFLLAAPLPVCAANADQPYTNVDKSNDAGNSTGNSQVDQLNRSQLDENQKPGQAGGTTTTAPPAR